MALHHLKGLAEYANLLRHDPAEMKALSRDFHKRHLILP